MRDRARLSPQLSRLYWKYCVSAVCWACTVITVHTNPHSAVTLIGSLNPHLIPSPCVRILSGLIATGKCRVETKLSLFHLVISGGKYIKATNNSPVLMQKKKKGGDSKVHCKSQKQHCTIVVYEAQQMKTSLSPGGGEVYS